MKKNLNKQNLTKQKLKNALIDLCNQKGYYNITIQDICHTAGTYRSTFYRYYNNKDDILREIERSYIQEARNLTPNLIKYELLNYKTLIEKGYPEFVMDMKYHYEHRQLFLFLLSPVGDPFFYKKMHESLTQIFEDTLRKNGIHLGKDQKYFSNYFASGYLSTIHEWLKFNDRTPEEIALFLIKMIYNFFAFFLTGFTTFPSKTELEKQADKKDR